MRDNETIRAEPEEIIDIDPGLGIARLEDGMEVPIGQLVIASPSEHTPREDCGEWTASST